MKLSLHLLIVLSVLLISPLTNITAEEYIFVDLDGDGLDDNIGDKDSDGIPDFSDEMEPQSDEAEVTGGTGIFSSMPIAKVDVMEITPCSKMYGQYSFSTRNLSTNRGGFSSSDGFGPENGLSGSSFGGVCVGPLCH
jgi:hypothetical protein